MKKFRLPGRLAAVALAAGLCMTGASASFTDTEGHWAADAIDRWSEGVFDTITLDESTATYYKRRTPADGVFDFTKPAKELHDFIRAQTEPYPGAFFWHKGEKITVLSSRNTGLTTDKGAGTVLGTTENGGIQVACGDGGVIELLRLRREDGRKLWFAEAPEFTGVL